MIAALLGFASPFLSDIFKFFTKRQENAHELAMLIESNRAVRDTAELNAQVGMAQAEVDDVRSARATQPSYGAKLLDTVSGDTSWINRYLIKPLLLLFLAFIEIANGLMRPYAIYLILSMWASTKVARFYFAYTAVGGGGDSVAELSALASAALVIWDDRDWAALEYTLGFLLGSRHKLREDNKR